MIDKFQTWFQENSITEVECLVPDLGGIARGKILPTNKFLKGLNEDSHRLPQSTFIQTISGDYATEDLSGPLPKSIFNPTDIESTLFGIGNTNLEESKPPTIPQFKEIVENTILSVYEKIECPNNDVNNHRCFKMLGYDVLIDDNYKLYLAEINARLISLKYPPPGFKEEFYTNILELVTSNDILTNQNEIDNKGLLFTYVTKKNYNYNMRYLYILLVVIALIFIIKSTI